MDHYLSSILRSLDFIEENLAEPVTLEAISRRAGFSLWHFQRIFTAYAGEPLGCYLRRRRLTAAAYELRTNRRSIVEIALDYQFESHAAFTRAFKAALRGTPTDFRQRRNRRWFGLRKKLTPADLQHHTMNLTMKPKIKKSPAFTLVGLEARFFGPMSPDANNHLVVPALFGQFLARRTELPGARDGFTYGACHCLPLAERAREDELIYLASVHVPPRTTVPPGMKSWRIPACTHALFQHRGPITGIDQTMKYIYGTWLPRSGYELAEGPSLERYDDRFGDGGKESEIDILIPITKRRRSARAR